MTRLGKFRRALRLGLLPLLVLGVVAHLVETRRIERALPRDASATPLARLDSAALLADVRELSSERFEGRGAGTPGGRLAREFVAERWRRLGLAPLGAGGTYFQPFAFTHTSVRALWRRDRPFRLAFSGVANVLGLVRGSVWPERYLVVSAHYDHLGRRGGVLHPGADDNASGVAALLGLAAWFQAHPPRHALVFAAFDAEELGLRGARAFVAAPPVPLGRVRLDVNLDMISRNEQGRLFVAGTSYTPELAPYVRRVASRSGVELHLGHDRSRYLTGLVDDWTYGSDHGAFHDAGVPFLYFGVEDHPDYHAPGDTFEHIQPRFFVQACETVLDLLLTLDQEWTPAA